jgi:hypothetical protein
MHRLVFPIIIILLLTSFCPRAKWGNFGHKRINRLAVFTLPPEMMPLYKTNIEYLTEHSMDADKRRFYNPHEGIRHYIDLDKIVYMPEDATEAKIEYTDIFVVTTTGDTLLLVGNTSIRKKWKTYFFKSKAIKKLFGRDSIALSDSIYRNFYFNNLGKIELKKNLPVSLDSLKKLFKTEQLDLKGVSGVFAREKLSGNGILTFHLQYEYKKLVEAFVAKDKRRILKISADLGHYIGDAHVPLHTTHNYDGQLTGQSGLHAFWETRIPELFADKQYDYWVGRAQFIVKPKAFFWKTVRESYGLLDSVFRVEKSIAGTYPKEQQYTLENRNNTVVKKQSVEYSALYQKRMMGMVENRMRTAIVSIGSIWYSAWLDAGQPDLSNLPEIPLTPDELEEQRLLDAVVTSKIVLGRGE